MFTVYGTNLLALIRLSMVFYCCVADGGPAEPSGSTFVTKAAIIGGGVLCGVFGVIIIILIVVCIRRRKPREDSSRFTDKVARFPIVGVSDNKPVFVF